jgi:hypothetical protein
MLRRFAAGAALKTAKAHQKGVPSGRPSPAVQALNRQTCVAKDEVTAARLQTHIAHMQAQSVTTNKSSLDIGRRAAGGG